MTECIKPTGPTLELVIVLGAIVMETMDNPPLRPHSINSYLPPLLIERAQSALKLYGLDIKPMPPARQSLSVLHQVPDQELEPGQQVSA